MDISGLQFEDLYPILPGAHEENSLYVLLVIHNYLFLLKHDLIPKNANHKTWIGRNGHTFCKTSTRGNYPSDT